MMRRVVSLELFCLEDGYLSANRFNLSFSHELKLFENMTVAIRYLNSFWAVDL